MKSRLYYETHVTLDPVDGERLEKLKALTKPFGFRVAELVMVKGGPSPKDSFCTARGNDYDEMIRAVRFLVGCLLAAGFVVRRYKIEDTLLDSRMDDELELLS